MLLLRLTGPSLMPLFSLRLGFVCEVGVARCSIQSTVNLDWLGQFHFQACEMEHRMNSVVRASICNLNEFAPNELPPVTAMCPQGLYKRFRHLTLHITFSLVYCVFRRMTVGNGSSHAGKQQTVRSLAAFYISGH